MTVIVKLSRKLDFRSIPALTEALEAALGSDIDLDASDVSQIGTQAMQLILSAIQSCALMNRSLTVSGMSAASNEQLALLGLTVTGSGQLQVRP